LFGYNPNAIDIERSLIAIAGAKIRKIIEICKFWEEKVRNFCEREESEGFLRLSIAFQILYVHSFSVIDKLGFYNDLCH